MNNIETNIICLATLFVVLYKMKKRRPVWESKKQRSVGGN